MAKLTKIRIKGNDGLFTEEYNIGLSNSNIFQILNSNSLSSCYNTGYIKEDELGTMYLVTDYFNIKNINNNEQMLVVKE